MSRSGSSRQPVSYFFRRAIDSILATPVISGVTITSIAVSVMLAGAVLLVGHNVFRLLQGWGQSGVDVSIYLTQDAGEDRVVELKRAIAEDGAVVDVRYVSQDEAWQFLADNLGDSAELLDGLDASLLPASLEVSLGRGTDEASLDARLEAWEAIPEVNDVQYNRQWIDRVQNAMSIVYWVAWALGALALIVSAIIVGATFQLAAFSRREEMEVMRLVGAVGVVYWGPVLLAGLFEGLIGSFAAIGMLSLIYQITATPITTELPMLLDTMDFLTAGQCFTLVFWGAMLGILGSWLGMQRFGSWR